MGLSFVFFGLLLEGGIVDADEAGNGGADEDALVAAVDGIVEASNGELGEEAAKGDALGIDDVGEEGLDDAKGEGVDDGLVEGAGAGAGTGLAVGGNVEKVAKDAGGEDAGKDPGEGGGPEARGEEQEHVGEEDVVVVGAEGGDGGDGKGEAVAEDLGADVVELKGGDGEENAGDGAKGLAGGARGLGDAALLVDGGDALAHGDGGAVDGKGNVGGGGGKGDAGSDLGEAAGGSAEDGARVGPVAMLVARVDGAR